jgi:hypothetical protein
VRKSMITGTAVALSLAVAGTAHAAVPSNINVQSLTAPWSASNSTVVKVADGVHFGTYADGGALGGSLMYAGANGLKLSDVTDYSFTFNYKQAGHLSGATPYARIFLDTNHDGTTDADVILDPSKGGIVTPAQGVDRTFGTADDSVRYGDDAGEGPQQSWDSVKAGHPNDEITNVLVSQGNSMGTDVSAMVKSITFNGTTFNFNAAPADGQGATGATSAVGSAGPRGLNGAAGVAGPAGPAGAMTIIHQPAVGPKLIGNTLRTLHAPHRSGMKLLSMTAKLRNKSLPVNRKSITVDLRGKVVGNYNVSITAKYRTKSGKVQTVRITRSLSVTTATLGS